MKLASLTFMVSAIIATYPASHASARDPSAREMFEASARLPKFPLIGDAAPEFEADTSLGSVTFPGDYAGRWVILFSHPADFTPVCTSEFVMFASEAKRLKGLNAELIGLSVDTVASHQAWKKSIREKITYGGVARPDVPFPIIADHDQEVAWAYGMLHPTASTTRTIRAVFIIDPKGVIRSILYYPPEVGRNIDEIVRTVKALQMADRHAVATPANWQPGEDVFILPDGKKRTSPPGPGCQDWYFCTKSVQQ